MIEKINEKQKAIELRRRGFAYGEILKIVPVAKSTLSLWLRSVDLSKEQKQRLTKRKIDAAKRGGEMRKAQRMQISERIKKESEKEIVNISQRELWLIGIALYWAEGSKENVSNISRGLIFSNADYLMIKIFLKWLDEVLEINKDDIKIEIYIHENYKNRIKDVIQYWSNIVSMSSDKFRYIYFKKNKIKTKRKNTGNNYYGLVKVNVKRSTNLNRKIQGWINGICNHCGIV